MRRVILALVCAITTAGAVPTAGQSAQKPAVTTAQIQARQQISALEAALEHAVRYGTQMFDQRLQASSAANMVMLVGMARARGFRLDNYGVMFDVEFPSMRRSVVWTLQELERANTAGGRTAMAATERTDVQPREIYQAEITEALANALLDYKESVGIGAEEWVTLAARESVVMDRRLVPGDAREMPMTVILRIRGAALQDLREKRVTRDEARKLIEVKTY